MNVFTRLYLVWLLRNQWKFVWIDAPFSGRGHDPKISTRRCPVSETEVNPQHGGKEELHFSRRRKKWLTIFFDGEKNISQIAIDEKNRDIFFAGEKYNRFFSSTKNIAKKS